VVKGRTEEVLDRGGGDAVCVWVFRREWAEPGSGRGRRGGKALHLGQKKQYLKGQSWLLGAICQVQGGRGDNGKRFSLLGGVGGGVGGLDLLH